MQLRRIKIEEETIDISERLRQLGHLDTNSLLSQRLAPDEVAPEPPASPLVPVERHLGRIYVAAAHGQPHFKSMTLLQRTRGLSA